MLASAQITGASDFMFRPITDDGGDDAPEMPASASRYGAAHSDGTVCMPGCENSKSGTGSISCSDEQMEGVAVKNCL